MAALLSLAIKVQSYFFPNVSSAHRFALSLCVVIIASAPNRFANSLERSFAPPICPDKTGICHGFMAIDPAAFGDPQAIRRHFSEYLEALRESPKAEGKDRIYTHGEKEVFAEKDRREHGLPVNDNTMVELANLCGYLKLCLLYTSPSPRDTR